MPICSNKIKEGQSSVLSKRGSSPKRRFQKILYVIFFILFSLRLSAMAAKVGHCTDGDTCWVENNGQSFKVRFDKVDVPESDQLYAKESEYFINKHIAGKMLY
jgi:endonuclease YncB( thermonuclease family)